QRGFVDIDSPAFSVSASMRRSTCEQVLRFARSVGWTVVHAFLVADPQDAAAEALAGFTPLPGEAYFKQTALSALGAPGLVARLESVENDPIFLASLAGVGAIGATFFDALERRLPMHLITNAIADAGRTELSERRALSALEAMAAAFDRAA